MRLLQCITDHNYIIWQLYVQMLNFREWGIEKDCVILCHGAGPSQQLEKFIEWTKARVVFYPDTRPANPVYFSSFRPNLIKQYIHEFGSGQTFFYHDQDIIFLHKPALDELAAGTLHYVAKEACSYLCSSYVDLFKRDGHNHLEDMCDIVGISPQLVREMDSKEAIGGGQYVLKNTDYALWDKVEHDSEAIYRKLRDDTAEEAKAGTYYVQIWTADMWAILYNLWLTGEETRQHPAIDFAWPWDPSHTTRPIMHNAGITAANACFEKTEEHDRLGITGRKRFFHKSAWNGQGHPFDEPTDYVSNQYAQKRYVNYFSRARRAISHKKILGILCTHNQINEQLLTEVMNRIAIAVTSSRIADVEIVVSSWKEIPTPGFKNMVTPFRGMGHLNYILQLKEVLASHPAEIVCILEHDVLYPDDYFDMVMREWDDSKYGLWNLNHIGVTEKGFQQVRAELLPLCMLSVVHLYFQLVLNLKLDECLREIHNGNGPYGSCYGLEPPNKEDFRITQVSGQPCVHVNMNHAGPYGTGEEGGNHHFTNYCEVSYEAEPYTSHHPYWGSVEEIYPVTHRNNGKDYTIWGGPKSTDARTAGNGQLQTCE